MADLDPRIVRVSVEVNGVLKTYEGLDIVASGTKYANANQNECEVVISNLNKSTRDFILTETSPFNLNRTPKKITVEAGRESYGVSRIFSGDVITSIPSQPPDIALTLKCLTGNYAKGNIISRNYQEQASLDQISAGVAKDLNLALDFQATNKKISNFNFSGGALKQVDKLGDAGMVSAYVDDNTLVVKDLNLPLANQITLLSAGTGMIGIPEVTEQGVRVKFLLDGKTVLGGLIELTSEIYPTLNGRYLVYKLSFEIASRDTPFYWIAETKRL